MSTSPTSTDPSDRPTTGPLVIGPVRGVWEVRDMDADPWTWVAIFGPWVVALVAASLEGVIDSMLGDHLGGGKSLPLLMGLSFPGIIVVFFRSSAWGNACWRLDDAGVSYTPPRRKPTSLAWDDVERVKLLGSITLRGLGRKILFPVTLPEADRREAARWIRERLGRDFDLEPRPRPRASIESSLRLMTIGLAVAAVVCATSFGPVLIQESGGPRIAWIGRTAFGCWMFLFLAGSITFLRHQVVKAGWVLRRPAVDGFKRQPTALE
ncbi:hypothetical protein [Paludisphaera rhizosphaerae]|uniref:hypothetical protein n=1 Tax=Paludisphaera rhizosphaerae TaxID=2711216 RepID=UPI0013ED17FF|nr:hypothetical protein [Paludisphaera rhizosphaerae]